MMILRFLYSKGEHVEWNLNILKTVYSICLLAQHILYIFTPIYFHSATMKKNGEKICLNPESKIIKNILKAINKKR